MTIEDILQETDINKAIEYLKSLRHVDDNEIEEIQKQLDPNQHDVTSLAKRPMRDVATKKINEDGTVTKSTSKKEVVRTSFAYQDDIVNKRVSFLLSNPIRVTTASEHKDSPTIINAINAINKSTKIDGVNREVFRTKITFKEVAELWYTTADDRKDRYGFKGDVKINVKIFKPSEKGGKGVKDILTPVFDDYQKLIAFGRGWFSKGKDGKDIEYFEIWTDDSYKRYKKGDSGWEEYSHKNIDETSGKESLTDVGKMDALVKSIGKIPITYMRQPLTEWHNGQNICNRNDFLASNHGEINDRHASPIIKATGEVLEKFADVVQMKDGADMDYISWSQATSSVEDEFNRNEDKIYALTRTPKTSLDALKGLGNSISGKGLEITYQDTYAECYNHMEAFDPYLTRRYNIIKSIIGAINNDLKDGADNTEIDVKATMYLLDGVNDEVRLLIDLYTSGMISLETACKMNPMFEDGLAEYEKIMAEKAAADTSPSGLNELMNEEN